jgi:hypothetical protein
MMGEVRLKSKSNISVSSEAAKKAGISFRAEHAEDRRDSVLAAKPAL